MQVVTVAIVLGVLAFWIMTPSNAGDVEDNTVYDFKGNSPDRFDLLFKRAGFYGDWRWLKAIAKQESDLARDARTRTGQESYDGLSWGLMQIAPGVGSTNEKKIKGNPTTAQLNNPIYSVRLAVKLLNYLYKKFNGDMRLVVLAYNQGEKRTERGENVTRSYYAKVFKWYNQILKGELS